MSPINQIRDLCTGFTKAYGILNFSLQGILIKREYCIIDLLLPAEDNSVHIQILIQGFMLQKTLLTI